MIAKPRLSCMCDSVKSHNDDKENCSEEGYDVMLLVGRIIIAAVAYEKPYGFIDEHKRETYSKYRTGGGYIV